MTFRVLGSYIEYKQAAKRLEELRHAAPNTPAARELKELTGLFLKFEKEMQRLSPNNHPERIFHK